MTVSPLDSEVKLTPMMEQYRSIKKTLSPDTLLFYRLGDFYEMFFEDALRASEILNITLTGREAGEAGRAPMCGIPYHAYQGYVKTLIEHNLKVAICEQVGDPKASKGLVERKIIRIISPATYLEDEAKSARAEYMIAVSLKGEEAALACLDLGTGEFFIRESSPEKLPHELSRLDPREIILPKVMSEDERWMQFVKSSLNAGVTSYDNWIFDPKEGLPLLLAVFKLSSARQLEISDKPLAVAAAGAVLYYLREHLHQSLDHLQHPRYRDSHEFMMLDRQAQKSLELVSNLSGDRYGVTLLSVLDQTVTSMGARTLHQWITQPLIQKKFILDRQAGVTELTRSSESLYALRGLLKGVRDMERTLSRLNCNVANARDLVNLKMFLRRVPEIRDTLKSLSSSEITKIAARVRPFPDVENLIEQAIHEEAPLGLRDGGLIRDNYRPDLDELRQISRQGKEWLVAFERREIERTGIRSLKVKYSQVFGYTIDISKANLHLVPSDYTRKQTLANAERFLTLELKEWDEKISGAQEKIGNLEYQIFLEVREAVLKHLSPLLALARAIGELDSLLSLAFAAIQKRWICPEITEGLEIDIRGGRHPVVEAMIPTGQFVENDTVMDGLSNQLIVLTGPNMAGKSTFIRQAAQIVLLAQIGSYVPAKSAKIGLVDRIFTRIGASDDLAKGESTFMVEMLETANILRAATDRSLLILDEVGRGTSTFDGVSIAWAICEFLTQGKSKPRTLFATHYHELTQLEEHVERIKNYHITVRESGAEITFLRKVVRGGSDRSYGIHVAKLAGIPETVLVRAQMILQVLESENDQATAILESSAGSQKKKMNSKQPLLFEIATKPVPAPKPEDHPVIQEIKHLNTNQMTPLEALAKLAELKIRLDRESY